MSLLCVSWLVERLLSSIFDPSLWKVLDFAVETGFATRLARSRAKPSLRGTSRVIESKKHHAGRGRGYVVEHRGQALGITSLCLGFQIRLL